MITDVAVRFSLPNTTITIGKPQIVTIPPSSSPENPESPPRLPRGRGLGPESAQHNSVTFADQVMPLNINKSQSQRDQYTNEPTINKVKSIIRRPLPQDASFDSIHPSCEHGELRYVSGNGLRSRFGSAHLPGLKEESVEDMSINEHRRRSDSRNGSQQLILPARIAAVKAMQERRLQESAEKSKARRAARHYNRPLADLRDLPSLNFSRMDLIDKLNEALEIRPARSMEIVRRRDFSGIYCPSPQRPQSTEPLRERYASFFSKPEDFGSHCADVDELDDEEDAKDLPAADGIPVVEVQESTKLEGVDEQQRSRPLSLEDFLNVADQVNRLSIPSVSGLSERLTNLLPALYNLHLADSVPTIEENVKHAIDDIQQLGDGKRPDTVLSNRTSAGFHTLAERAEEIVKNGTHDSMMPTRKLLTDKELPPLPVSASADKVSAINSTDGKASYLTGSVSAPSDLGQEPARPPPALVRHKSPMSEEEVQQLLPPEMNPITRSKRSLIISSASRRWNQDENYPWAGTNVPVDLTVPTEAHTRDLTGELICNGRSLEVTSSGEPTDTTKGIDIGSITKNLDRSASITTEQATGVNVHHLGKHSRRSIIGSISKKIGFSTLSRTTHGEDATRSVPSPASRPDDGTLPHKPGDRYPSSSLTPPAALNLDEVRSFFSDDSSERQHHRRAHGASFRKRLTKMKAKPRPVRLDPADDLAYLDGSTTYDAGSLNAERAIGTTSSAHTYDGIGMGKAEFHFKRFGEKLRQLFVRGGELIRSLSKRTQTPRAERVRDDWLSDSLYSGV
ncbi:hypothetical protein BAUCODRAFT_30375 [Baudoinia panamericana UAMH 10762]|uniref:Uncharacterized protein n=1 Tax=Baudoinia panamericana (strain UAMH 10762) TaxID=717646 RepID=M2LZ35_BAUPA|nr:uncharacterized protein BAUCODRAFT_30375 [Baudoinia panamericana UAMH 10762]EMC99952.1 hypothetical protein BAUCODRAFT_30375 [Baudoinia panamericana UAMH 10762]